MVLSSGRVEHSFLSRRGKSLERFSGKWCVPGFAPQTLGWMVRQSRCDANSWSSVRKLDARWSISWPIIFCVISRYHGGAYVVFSQALNDRLTAVAVRGSTPVSSVVDLRLRSFSHDSLQRVQDDARIQKPRPDSVKPREQRPKRRNSRRSTKRLKPRFKGRSRRNSTPFTRLSGPWKWGHFLDCQPDQLRTQLHRQLSEGLERYLADKDASN